MDAANARFAGPQGNGEGVFSLAAVQNILCVCEKMEGQHAENDFVVCWFRDRDMFDLKAFFVGFEDCGFTSWPSGACLMGKVIQCSRIRRVTYNLGYSGIQIFEAWDRGENPKAAWLAEIDYNRDAKIYQLGGYNVDNFGKRGDEERLIGATNVNTECALYNIFVGFTQLISRNLPVLSTSVTKWSDSHSTAVRHSLREYTHHCSDQRGFPEDCLMPIGSRVLVPLSNACRRFAMFGFYRIHIVSIDPCMVKGGSLVTESSK